jgi:type II secretory pathway pseudopilin PulG
MNKIFCNFDTGTGEAVIKNESGFSLTEFIVSASILLVFSVVIFSTLNKIQGAAARQSDTQAVLDNTRIALQVVERCIRQSGNDPFRNGFEAISVVSSTEVRIRSDITGSAGPGNPNKGDPDGDINDSGEDLTIRYNNSKQRIEMISSNGPAQIIADNIAGFSLQYFDAEGNETHTGKDVRKIKATISGSAAQKDMQTEELFGAQMENTTRILT